ncbi:MAG: peptide chain release factor N(5)-glutamine methyltransferase [Planctomycetes bacterium]|nr:peptide chain release factor N(5)-glutamine methyltransferase [Planctomycetota bacterium]
MTGSDARPRSVRDVLAAAAGWLAGQGVADDEARLDAELLLAHTLRLRRLDLYLDHDRPLDEAERERFRGLMRRRGEGREPVAYLLGERGFYGLTLNVGPGVLVPRPETEHLVEVGLEALRAAGPAPTFVDVGTGSGCVALALLREHAPARGLGVDRAPDALAFAVRNARDLGLADRLVLARGDLLGAVRPASVDLVVSNPPYVTPDEAGLLALEVARWEPRGALFDAPGLPLTAALARQARAALRPGGTLAVETGQGKAALVRGLLEQAGLVEVRTVQDLAGIERIVAGRAPS